MASEHVHARESDTLCDTGDAELCSCGWWRRKVWWGRGYAFSEWYAPPDRAALTQAAGEPGGER